MSVQVTPSKKVSILPQQLLKDSAYIASANLHYPQAASGLENLKMSDSPIKKLDFGVAGKENVAIEASVVPEFGLKKPDMAAIKAEEKPAPTPTVAPTIKPEEANEPLLQENPHRFVLFPIKYHEVRVPSRVTRKVSYQSIVLTNDSRSGKCTRRPKPLSGQQKRSICRRI